MNAKKHDNQRPGRDPAPPAEQEKTDTEKVAAGEPVAVVGTEVEGTTAAPAEAKDSDGGTEGVGVAMNAPSADAPAEPEPRTDHLDGRGNPVYRNEFGACLFLALGGKDFPGEPENFDLIPFELAMFFRGEPDAPDAAGLSHLSLKLKTILLPDEDPRRVELAVKLFRTAINGLDAIEKADDTIARLKQEAAHFKPAHDRLDGDGPFDKEQGRLEKSDLGRALDKQRA